MATRTVLIVYGLIAICGLLALLAGETLPGYPEATQKTLSLYTQPDAANLPLSVYIHPPIARIQVDEGNNYQDLTFQFTNRGVAPLAVRSLQSNDECFVLEPATAFSLEPQQSTFKSLRLTARKNPPDNKRSCLGQHPLVFHYTWTVDQANLRFRLNSVSPTAQNANGLTIAIPEVLFDFDKSTLKPAAQGRLARIAAILRDAPSIKVRAEGYADVTGADARNLTLSSARAIAVQRFLIAHGLPPGNIVTEGFGTSNPAASNRTESGRAKNRRVYLILSQSIENQQSVSTSPLRITTKWRLRWERFFHLAALILLPALIPFSLLLASSLVQKNQDRKAALQARQQRDLEVWKAILPIFMVAIQKHYIPLLSVLSNLKDELKSHNPEWRNILAYALIFRVKVTNLVNESGGFYFRNRDGESLCSQLANILNDRFYEASGRNGGTDAFLSSAEELSPNVSMITVKIRIEATTDPSRVAMCDAFKGAVLDPTVRAQLYQLTVLIYDILNYETNAPLYANWYGNTPKFTKALSAYGLGLKDGDDSEESVQDTMQRYQNSAIFTRQQRLAKKQARPLKA